MALIPQINKKEGRQKLANLYSKYQTVTDPAQQQRMQTRASYLQNQYGLKNNPFSSAAPATPAQQSGKIPVNQMTKGQARDKLTNLYSKYSQATDPAQQQRIENRAGFIQKKAGIKKSPFDVQPVEAQPTTPDAEVSIPEPVQTIDPEQQAQMYRAMFPDFQSGFERQADIGQTKLAQLLAKRGLSNSSAEINTNREFLEGLSAKTLENQMALAQRNADRLAQLQEAGASRAEREQDRGFNQYMDYLRYLQSELPPEILYGSTKDASALAERFGKSKADYLKNAYERLIPSTSGGGMPFMAPFPSGPNTMGSQLLGLMGRPSTGWSAYLPAITGMLGGASKEVK